MCDPVECISDFDCDDGLFCSGIESCILETNTCGVISACPATIPPTICNEMTDSCDPVLIFENGFESGNVFLWSNSVP